MLHVDSREPRELKDELVAVLGADNVNILKLDSADFLIFDCDGVAVGIERKTVSDFLASLATVMKSGDGRLNSQLTRMDVTYPHRILLLEGHFDMARDGKLIVGKGKKSGWTHAAFQMALLSVQRRRHFDLLHTPDRTATVDTLRVLHSHISARPFVGVN